MQVFRRVFQSWQHSIRGLVGAFRQENSLRMQGACGLLILILMGIFGKPLWQGLFGILCLALVLAFELMNTAVEKLCNKLIPVHDLEVRYIKDVMSASVWLVIVASLCVLGVLNICF